ncbi:MAG: DNA-binding protein [Candidimonas sp.]|nr:DNA-binding protein [Candidimonas sp.]
MRPTEVSDEQIIQAGLQLEAQQSRVTGFALRRVIGAGTPARLVAVWNAYKQSNAPAPAPAEDAPPLPGDIEPALKVATDQIAANLRQLVITLHGHCQREARTKVVQVEQEADAKCALYLEELADASSQIEKAESLNDSLERQCQQTGSDLSAANERIAALTGELAKANERLERAAAELSKAREMEEVARQAEQQAVQASQQLERELEDAKQAHAEDLGRHQEVLAGELEKRKVIEGQLANAEVTRDAVSEQSNSKSLQLASLEAKIKALDDRLLDHTVRLDEQHSVIVSQRQTVGHLERQNERLNEHIAQLEQQAKNGDKA